MSVRARKPVTTVVSKAAAYDTILRPIITEKRRLQTKMGRLPLLSQLTRQSHKLRQQLKCCLMSKSQR